MGLLAGLPHVLYCLHADSRPPPSLSVLFCHWHECTHSYHRSYLQEGMQEIILLLLLLYYLIDLSDFTMHTCTNVLTLKEASELQVNKVEIQYDSQEIYI